MREFLRDVCIEIGIIRPTYDFEYLAIWGLIIILATVQVDLVIMTYYGMQWW